MSVPYIALTLAAIGVREPQPIFVNAIHIRTANPCWTRKPGTFGNDPDDFELTGTWICVGSGDDGTFAVTESYGEVTGAIRDVMK